MFWEAWHDDFAGNPEDWEPQPADSGYVSYVTISDDDGRFIGMAIANKHSEVQIEIHNALLPEIGWKKRVQAGRELLEWLWAAGRKRVIGKVIASNRYALKYNEFMGMERIGTNRAAFLKDCVLQDEVWFGISAP